MTTTRIELDEIRLAGLDLGHTTTNEGGQSSIDGEKLWKRFQAGKVAERIVNKTGDELYAVYYGYEGDHTKPFRYFLGCRVPAVREIPDEMDSLTIPASRYHKLTAKGKMPDCMVNTWKSIWESGIDRGYQYDFEVYDERSQNWNDAEVDIYLS